MRSSLFAAVLLLVLMPPIALAEAYRYTDDRGTLVIVDQESKVPEKYRPRVESFEMETHTDGYTPSYAEAVIADGNTGAIWYKYENMSWADKKMLVARAGMTDLKGVARGMLLKFALVFLVFIGAIAANFIFVKKRSLRALNSMLLIMVLMLVSSAFYLQATLARGDEIASNMNKVTPGGDQVPSGGEGMFAQLRDLQEMSDERQQLFKMIIEEDSR